MVDEKAFWKIIEPLCRELRVSQMDAAQLIEAYEAAKASGQPVELSVDHRKIGCLIHDNIDLSKRKHEITLAIYDAIKPYLVKDSQNVD